MGVTPDISNLSIAIRRPCALVSGSFSVPLSSSLLVELGYVSCVQKERHENITFFTKKNTVHVRPELPHDCI